MAKEGGVQLVFPCSMRWNSVYDAVAPTIVFIVKKVILPYVTSVMTWTCHGKKITKKELKRYIYNFSGSSVFALAVKICQSVTYELKQLNGFDRLIATTIGNC